MACDIIGLHASLVVDFIEFTETVVGGSVILEVTPHVFHRVELRCVRRQPLDREPRIDRPPVLQLLAAMSIESIPYQNDVPAKMTEQIAQEGNDLGRADVFVRMPVQEQPQVMPFGREGQRPDGGNLFVASCTVMKDGGLASRSPRPTNGRKHEKTSFIDENDVCAFSRGFFLDEANPSPPTARSALRRVRSLAFRASGTTSRAKPAAWECDRRDNERRSTVRSLRRSVDRSTGRSKTRWSWHLSSDASQEAAVDRPTTWALGRDAVWRTGLRHLLSGEFGTNGLPSPNPHPTPEPPRHAIVPPGPSPQPDASGVPIPLRFHAVSYNEKSVISRQLL